MNIQKSRRAFSGRSSRRVCLPMTSCPAISVGGVCLRTRDINTSDRSKGVETERAGGEIANQDAAVVADFYYYGKY